MSRVFQAQILCPKCRVNHTATLDTSAWMWSFGCPIDGNVTVPDQSSRKARRDVLKMRDAK